MSISKKQFGRMPDGTLVDIFTIENNNGMILKVISYGAAVVSLKVPDRSRKLDDIVLGYDNLKSYIEGKMFFGAVIGRHANRIKNASFTINGIWYNLAKNEGENHLHGGNVGFDKVVWSADDNYECRNNSLTLRYCSKDGEEGYPGDLDVRVIYTLTDDNALRIDYYAVSDKDTVVNLTNHSYFNLSGHDAGEILNDIVTMNADRVTVNDNECIPNGEIRNVKGTPMDFTKPERISEMIDYDYDQIKIGNGYDQNYIINRTRDGIVKAAEVYDEKSGRVMEVFTTQKGIQFYTGNNIIDNTVGKGNAIYNKRYGLCFETQCFPNSLMHDNFPSALLKADTEYANTTIYKFSIK